MVVSFHPCFVGDQNRLCAGRLPDTEDLSAIQSASAVILPQGCSPPLYEMARRHCTNVFPNYRVRFGYPGKTGQVRLFEDLGTPHPQTWIYSCVDDFETSAPDLPDTGPTAFPFVLKLDWGGEGEGVFLVENTTALNSILNKLKRMKADQSTGFLVQEFIPAVDRTLRVAVVGGRRISYWRYAASGDQFQTSLSRGATIDAASDPDLQSAGVAEVDGFCEKTGINLAGFDLMFRNDQRPPLFLEINYFFGRRGLGGSERYYRLLEEEIRAWLDAIDG
jgi:ribosomal protein S6--L-glutamate ligase